MRHCWVGARQRRAPGREWAFAGRNTRGRARRGHRCHGACLFQLAAGWRRRRLRDGPTPDSPRRRSGRHHRKRPLSRKRNAPTRAWREPWFHRRRCCSRPKACVRARRRRVYRSNCTQADGGTRRPRGSPGPDCLSTTPDRFCRWPGGRAMSHRRCQCGGLPDREPRARRHFAEGSRVRSGDGSPGDRSRLGPSSPL